MIFPRRQQPRFIEQIVQDLLITSQQLVVQNSFMTKYTKEQMMSSPVLYDDENIKVRQKCITLKTYYFPICTSKRIPIDEIENIQIVQTEFNGRVWGLGGANGSAIWLACDAKRFGESGFMVLNTKQKIKPAFTCCDNLKVFHLIQKLLEKQKLAEVQKAEQKTEEKL